MDRELLIQYVDILNKMENLPYDVRMSRNDLDYSIVDFFEKKAAQDVELQEVLKQIKSLPSNERVDFVKKYLAEKDAVKEKDSNNEEEEIAAVFGIDAKDIQHLFLANGNEIFYFYDDKLNRNIVLENNKKGKSLLEQLQDIQNKFEEYQTEDNNDNAHNILKDEALNSNLELGFYSKEEIENHMGELDNLNEEDIRKIRYLLQNYNELMIQGINIENMVYIDKSGKIMEVTLVDDKINIAMPNSEDNSFEEKQVNSTNESEMVESNTNSSELDDMLDDDQDVDQEEKENEKEEDEVKNPKVKPKVYTYNNDNMNSGFTNNAMYFFIAGLILLIIFVLLFIVIS